VKRLAAAVVLALLTLLAPRRAQADAPSPGPAYRLHLDTDLAIVLIGAATTSGFVFLDENGRGPACLPSCRREQVNAFDRGAAGNYSTAWGSVGDIATAGTMVFAPLVVLLAEGWKDGLNDDLVLAESALLASAFQVTLSYAVARPRPRVYGDAAPLEERNDANAARSFFSGHTANVVAVTVAGMRTFQRLGRPALAYGVLAAGLAGSTVVGVGRVLSGGHFPSDVLLGAAADAGIGLALPALHESGARIVPTGSGDGAGVTVVGAF
jgi:membrane-associated phospholipid phosphatase